jgi:hypothetical protein
MIKIYYSSTNKREKKRAAKLLIKAKGRLKHFRYWEFLNEEELNDL